VLKDPTLGADTNRAEFADTNWHLNPQAAARRTDELAREIQQWETWQRTDFRSAADADRPRSE
jgi:hypothetical protein